MNFADYVYNMSEEDFEEAREIVKIAESLPVNHELKQRIQALREIFVVVIEQ